jgi:hypothetical protein
MYGTRHAGGLVATWPFQGQWDDLQGPVFQAGGVSALTTEQYRDAPYFASFMRHDQNDALYYIYQIPHRWWRGTAVRLHMHYTPMATWVPAPASYNVRMEVAHVWVAENAEIPAAVGWTVTPVDLTVVPTDQYKALLTIAYPAGAKESTILRARIRRLGTDGADTYTVAKDHGTAAANLAVWDFDCHYQCDKPGTVTELPV